MKHQRLGAEVLSVKLISNVSPSMAKALDLEPHQKSVGLITSTCDDVTYVALDEATKAAQVDVVYAKSFYGGADNANSKLAGEVIGMIAGVNPAEVKSGLRTLMYEIEEGSSFYSANDDNTIAYFAHLISRVGKYLSKETSIPEGSSLAYCIAPPLEAMYGLDAALKTANVEIAVFFDPPTETNFGGALLTGSQSACKAACEAFANAVNHVAEKPIDF